MENENQGKTKEQIRFSENVLFWLYIIYGISVIILILFSKI